MSLGESEEANGYYVVSGNVTKYYTEDNHLTGSEERKDGKVYYKDNKGNVLYLVHRTATGYSADNEQYYDSKNRLRYEIEYQYQDDVKLTLYEYSEKGELINTYNDSYFYAEPYGDPHEAFKPLKDIIESSYYIPEK